MQTAKGEIEKIRKMCEELSISKGRTTDEYLYTIDAVDLFFYKRNIGKIDIKSYFVDGKNDGGIDFVYPFEDTLYLIQGKSSPNLKLEDIKNVFNKIDETVLNFENKKYDKYSKELKSAYLNAFDAIGDEKNIELVLFTKTHLNDQTRKDISEIELNCNASIQVYDDDDYKNREAVLYQDSDLISYDSLELYINPDKKNYMLQYGEDGIIVNIKATSLKKLFDKYRDKGLFSYNLREHIIQKSVDEGIDNTIKNEREKFWYYNNGITIGCNDFKKDGNRIKLYGFSIINGAQTTTRISKSKYLNDGSDFALVCKIVRAHKSFKNDVEFISKISEASNSQKPIKPRDLKSNTNEQRRLQVDAAKNIYPLSIEIKRGVKPKNYKKVEKWQRVTNEYIGQLIYACVFQKPGPARNNKVTIFSSNKVYRQLFMRKHDFDTLYDLVRIANAYDEFVSDFVSKTDNLDLIAIAKNGKFTVLAVLIYLYKKETGILSDYTSDEVHKDNLKGLLITSYPKDDLDKNLHSLFTFIIRQLKRTYETNQAKLQLTSYSNFFKSEQVYNVILQGFDEIDPWDKEKLSSFMVIFREKKN